MSLVILQKKLGQTPDGKISANLLKSAMSHFNLTPPRVAHFFGQTSHETGNFTIFTENLNYSAQGLRSVFKKYFPTDEIAAQYQRQPEKIANRVYANRMGNGDEASGDGWKYRGRGSIQLTGKENYAVFGKYSARSDILTNPDIVASELAFESGIFFFDKNKLWNICDAGIDDSTILVLTKKVNGGTNGLDDRVAKTKAYWTLLNPRNI